MTEPTIRQRTWDEETKEYALELPVAPEMEPDRAVREYNLQPQKNVNPNDYPAGTWFYYPKGRDEGVSYVRV